jgi:hypothetical protein
MRQLGKMRGRARRRHRRLLRRATARLEAGWGQVEVKHPWELRAMHRLESAGRIPEDSFVYKPWPRHSGQHAPGMTEEAWRQALQAGRGEQ